jgi:amino acid transporter
MLIMFNVIVNARHLYTTDRFWTYETPYGFSAQNMTISPATDTDPGVTYTGTLGQFTAFFSAMCTTIFSILGWEVILFTAPENADLKRTETMKISSRKIALRVIVLYALATFTVGLNVPYTDENLVNLTIEGIGGGEGSAFIISAVRNHVLYLPHILNAFYIFSACSTGTNALYSASRTLHALASIPDAWPTWSPIEALRSRLERTIFGVPMAAVFVSWLVGFLAFLSTSTVESATLGRIADFTVVGTLIVYSMNCAAYLQFYRAINDAAEGKLDEDLNLTPEMRNLYKRTAKRYPYRSHLQWLRAAYGLTGCTIIAIFQGWRTFEPPFAVKDFVAAYIAVRNSLSVQTLLTCHSLFFSPFSHSSTLSSRAASCPVTGASAPTCSSASSLLDRSPSTRRSSPFPAISAARSTGAASSCSRTPASSRLATCGRWSSGSGFG